MLDSVILIQKSRKQRLEEFKDILNSRDVSLAACDIADEWSYHTELLLEPGGWQAIWKISRQICEDLHIKFPKLVYVSVNGVDFKELSAFVSVMCIQDDITIPENHEVPLIQLYPTKKQENGALNINETAKVLDQLRFFYNHLWYPWDLDDSDGENWCSKYLEPRLHLFYDMQEGVVSDKLADKISSLRERAHSMYSHTLELEDYLSEEGENKCEEGSTVQSRAFELTQLHLSLESTKSELSMLENPDIRKLYEDEILREDILKKASDVIAVWGGGSIKKLSGFIKDVEVYTPLSSSVKSVPCRFVELHPRRVFVDREFKAICRIASSLEDGISMAVPGNTLVLDSRIHEVARTRLVKDNMFILGMQGASILRANPGNILFEAGANELTIHNTALLAKNVEMVILAYSAAKLQLVNCLIGEESPPSTAAGIVILPGGSADIKGCEFLGLHVALLCHSGANINVTGCNFKNCNTGIQADEALSLKIERSTISGCKDGVVIGINSGISTSGNAVLLQGLKGISTTEIVMELNQVDVTLRSRVDITESSDPSSVSKYEC